MGGSGFAVDATTGNLLPKLVNIAWPAILQSILSNCYAFNDYVFIGHIKDPAVSAAGTTALSATIGLQVISFALQNCIPSGSNTFCSQYKGAGDNIQLAATFRAAFYACLVVSLISASIGYSNIRTFAGLCNAGKDVENAIVLYFGTLLLSSPAFSLLLLVDGFYKSCGDTQTPLRLELLSLCLNTLLNFIMVVQLDWGIRGAALATVLSRLMPALLGLVGILRGSLGVNISLNPFYSVVNEQTPSNNVDSAKSSKVIELTSYSSVPIDEDHVGPDIETDSNNKELPSIVDETDLSLSSPSINDQSESVKVSINRVISMLRIGVSQSISDCIYGAVFTIMIRLAGELGQAQQAGYGAAMRGLEWLAYCAGEGFLSASMTSVGQCVGAGLFKRAMDAAIQSAALSALATGILGIPFILFPEQIASIITGDENIIKYTAQYLLIVGYAMSTVGIEMACYGAMLGAGQAGRIVLINGSMNLIRVPLAVLCLYGSHRFWPALFWAIGISGNAGETAIVFNNTTSSQGGDTESYPNLNSSGLGPPSGTFACICWVVAGTAAMKAVVYICWLSYRVVTKTYFSDSRVIS